MSAVVIPVPAGGRAATSAPTIPCPPPERDRLPMAIQSAPGAVAIYLPGTEWWLSPEQARELASELWTAAELADTAEREGEV